MFKCTRCKRKKDISEFNFKNKKSDIRHRYCKECGSFYLKSHYRRNKKYYLLKAYERNQKVRNEIRNYLYSYLTKHHCLHCGEKDPIVLEFDHIDNLNKKSDISSMVKNYNLIKVKEEIEKCQILCANCHRKKTAKDRGWYKNIAPVA